MNFAKLGAAIAVLAAAALAVFPLSSPEKRAASELQLLTEIEQGEMLVDPGELLDLITNDAVALRILDVRPESDYNLFHIIDSQNITPKEYTDEKWAKTLPVQTVIVLASNDEARGLDAWKALRMLGVTNLYVLRGGINFWLDVYGREYLPGDDINAVTPSLGNDTFRHGFESAMGARQPGAEPDPHAFPERTYIKRVKSIGGPVRKSGGCG